MVLGFPDEVDVLVLAVLQKHRGHPSGAGIGSMKKPFGQLRIHCIAPRQEGLDNVVRDLVEDNVLEDEDDNVDVVCNRVVRVVEVCGVDVVDIGVVFCCVITGDDVSGGLVVTTCDVVPVVVIDWVEAGCNVMAWGQLHSTHPDVGLIAAAQGA